MKQSIGSSTHVRSSFSALFGDDEIEVSSILLHLPRLIFESEPLYRFQFGWGARRRRSAIDSTSSPPPRRRPTLPPPENTTCRGEHETSSPATPLFFLPSESSDDKSNRSRRKKRLFLLQSREEWLEMVEGLVHRRELLRRELEAVKNYWNKLKTLNLELKAKRQELSFATTSSRLTISERLDYRISQPIHYMVHHEPSVAVNRTDYSETFQYSQGQFPLPLSPGSGLATDCHMGPPCIPDLNVSAEEAFGVGSPQPFDLGRGFVDNKARAAEARRRRMVRIKEAKNSLAAMRPARCR
ncbi:hypothetical protein NMG60_11024449 [Bertholletia excelsa]